ncbi:phytoene/squalene synthase family protein [Sphingomonas sp. BIUV-7]|uniref:Phytoene/squalene synthase family protein n=1 Tax=Sphingomonas natans TaxID=3063330 RepID=A0ABT8YE83_9SPHN|nr:phytoene/squalene synthase family protein [Sphingomonas sp. BIUV-7]MDO6415964.1 phytoene/squalene synthase family protein [Sphingomonas sp. BIUV-7]
MSADRAALVEHARLSIARGSKSFAMASKLFDPATRERAWLLYAWCRACDDIADGQDHGHGMTRHSDGPERIARIRELTTLALAGHATGEPAFDALGLVAAECGIPANLPFDVIDGFALDGDGWSPRTEDDLYRYCYHVAGAVGVMMAIVMGVSPDDEAVLDRACDLGIAFQLANIARDLSEDDAVGRCYLPSEWLAEMDIPPGEHMRPAHRAGLVTLVRLLTDGAARHEASARIGAYALPFRARWAVLAAADIYGGIGREVARRGAQAWDHRVFTSKWAKLGAVIAAWRAARRPAPIDPPPRGAALWTRPR